MLAGMKNHRWRYHVEKDKIVRTKPKEKFADYSAEENCEWHQFTFEDVVDIERNIDEVDGQSCSERDIGWVSPLKQKESIGKKQYVLDYGVYTDNLNLSNSTLKDINREDRWRGKQDPQDSIRTYTFDSRKLENDANFAFSYSKQNQKDNEWTHQLSLEVRDKLQLAEERFELELAKERAACLQRLQDMLYIGKHGYFDEYSYALIEEWKIKRSKLVKELQSAALNTTIHCFSIGRETLGKLRENPDRHLFSNLLLKLKESVQRILDKELQSVAQDFAARTVQRLHDRDLECNKQMRYEC